MWWGWMDLNHRPKDYESSALTTELHPQNETPFQGFSSRGAWAKPKSPAALPELQMQMWEAANRYEYSRF